MTYSSHPRHPQHPHTASPVPLAQGHSVARGLGLGIDAGGTQTRWALAHPSGAIVASGHVDGLTALHMAQAGGQRLLQNTFAGLASTVQTFGTIASIEAGMTGCGDDTSELRELIATRFGLPSQNVAISNDISIAYRAVFEPGEGYLVYAGTGSIAAFIDEHGGFHRVGGHGFLLDDAGSGFWIARAALRHIWRKEDEHPGCWRDSPMAQKVFAHIGGPDWSTSKNFIYQGSRGDIGKLALAVAAAADADPVASQLLQDAGKELARLALALSQRFGDRPVALGGRVQELHPLILQSMRSSLPDAIALTPCVNQAHIAAALVAAKYNPSY